MNNYLDVFEKFKDVKEILDLCDEVQKLRAYYRTGQYNNMQEHIKFLTLKYAKEAMSWNARYPQQPITYEQAYINAESFMCEQGVKLIVDKVFEYKNRLTPDEIAFIESIIKPVE